MDENDLTNNTNDSTQPTSIPPEQPAEPAQMESINQSMPEHQTSMTEQSTSTSVDVTAPTPTPAPTSADSLTTVSPTAKTDQLSSSFKKGFLIYVIVCIVLIVASIAAAVISQLGSGELMSTTGSDNQNNQSGSNSTTDDIVSSLPNAVIGGWKASGGDYWVFERDGDFYWYESYNDLSDNYYVGTAQKYLRGTNATNELGISQDKVDNLTTQSNGQITVNDIYYLKLRPELLHSNGTTKTQDDTDTDLTFEILFVITGEDSAQMLNFSTDSGTIYLTKVVD